MKIFFWTKRYRAIVDCLESARSIRKLIQLNRSKEIDTEINHKLNVIIERLIELKNE